MSSSSLAIALVSGGMDSLVSAAIAHEQHPTLAMLHLNYGQRTEEKELASFHRIADHYNVEIRQVIDVGFLRQIGGSSLTDHSMPVTHYSGDKAEIPSSYVPFRNTHIIAMAVSWAEVIGAKRIYIGAVYEDSSGYPDCRPAYYEAYNRLIQVGTKAGDIEIVTPIIHMSKKEIVLKAIALHAPIASTWSCYERNDRACGVCDSCALRLRGFQEAKIDDPIEYVQRPQYN